MKKFCNIIFVLISIFNTVSCIITLCVICPRVDNIGFDYLGVIVGVLALLVTILIGWNIFSVLDFKKEILNKIEENRKKCMDALKAHSDINNREFDNVVNTFKNAERYCNILDKVLFKHISEQNEPYQQDSKDTHEKN